MHRKKRITLNKIKKDKGCKPTTPLDGYQEITEEENQALQRMTIRESTRLTELLLKQAKIWTK